MPSSLGTRQDIPTPALLLDLDAFEWNVTKMATYLAERRRGFRPHGKTHKCPEIAKRLIAAGAKGSCTAKLSEAEVFADHDIRGLLVTTAVLGPSKIARAIVLSRQAPDTIFVVDHAENARDLNDAARNAEIELPLAVDLFFGRTGITPGDPAVELARLIDSLSNVRFAGLQAYDGTAAHTLGFEARRARTRETMTRAVETRWAIEQSGIVCPMVSSGSTGTYNFDCELHGITELQPGSFIFMDLDYARIGGHDSATYTDFRRSLSVLTTVVSKQETTAIVDGGYKAFSTDLPLMPQPIGLTGVSFGFAGDEHGRLNLTRALHDIEVGDRIEFVAPHCDPTVNLYDRIYALRGDDIEGVWPIAARGMSQ